MALCQKSKTYYICKGCFTKAVKVICNRFGAGPAADLVSYLAARVPICTRVEREYHAEVVCALRVAHHVKVQYATLRWRPLSDAALHGIRVVQATIAQAYVFLT